MKKIIILTFVAISTTILAQDMREPQRVVNSKRANLQPLFTWWTNAGTITKSNLALSAKKKIPVPQRVMPAWIRITTSEITNTGRYWIGTAQVQDSPGSRATNQIIALLNGPFAEKKKVDAAAARLEQSSKSRASQNDWASFNTDRASVASQRASQYQEIRNAGGGRSFGNLANDYSAAARNARADAAVNERRAANLASEIEQLRKITKGRRTMTVDTFALRTGELYAGLPVYDMGLAGR